MPLKDKEIPLLVNGAINTKSNPKLVQPPALLELENQYQLRTGELRTRNGFSKLTATTHPLTEGANLFLTKNGGLATIARNWNSATSYPQALKYGNSASPGWDPESGASGTPQWQHPTYTALVEGVEQGLTDGASVTSAIDPDMGESGGFRGVTWTDGAANCYTDGREITTGRIATNRWARSSLTVLASSASKIAISGSSQSGLFWADAGTTLKAAGYTSNGTSATAELTLAADLAVFYDVKAIPGTGNIAVAYKASAGGIKCGIFNPSTGTFTSVVTTAGADASFCLGWLDDQLSTGNMYLATAGSTSGVVVRTINPATMAVTATNTIDATATANVRNVTGHIIANATNYMVLWDVSSANPVDDTVKQGIWTGAATVRTLAYGQSLYSRSAKFPDGNYHVLTVYGSAVQPGYQLVPCDRLSTGTVISAPIVCQVLSGEAAGRRLQSSLTTPMVSGSSVTMAVSRNRKISTPTGDVVGGSLKTTAILTFTSATKVTRARELGGTVFIPGGVLSLEDGAAIQPAVFPFYPEAPTGSSSNAGGSMTASGTYLYRTVFKAFDATGRIIRSAGSVQFSITLGAADNRVTLTVANNPTPRRGAGIVGTLKSFASTFCEIYRRGPTSTGATLYNKVGELQCGPDFPPSTFIDTTSDTNAALGEVAYFSGNTLENFAPPAHTLLEVNGNRVGVVNAEDPTEFFYSKEYKAGAGIGFNPLQKVRISGDGAGGITALAAMDGRWILFKRSAIYVLSGDGPNDLGQGSFNQPQAVSRTLGTTNPSSVIETPDGIMFEAPSQGIWLLGRDLSVSYVGAPVEQYTLAEDVAGAAPVTGLTTVRFVMPSGRCLEWDYHHKRWYTHQLRVDRSGVTSTVVDCANSSLFGWCYLLANGDLMQEVAGQTTDVNGTTTAIIPRIGFPVLQLSGLAGYQRFRSVDFTLDVIGNCILSVDAEYNYSGALTGTPKTIALTTATPTAQVTYTPPEGRAKCTSVRLVLTVQGNPTNGTFRLTGANAYVAVKRGSNVVASNRMT